MQIRELRTKEDVEALVILGSLNRAECAPTLAFVPDAVRVNGYRVLQDMDRRTCNVWLVWKDGEAIAYAVGNTLPFFYNNDYTAILNLLFVKQEYRSKGWAVVRLVKAFEDWARLNGAVRMSVGVERTEVDEAKRIRAMFPKLGYSWAGSHYLKEITR